MSRRTLQRKLKKAATTFRDQVQEMQQLLAESYFANTDMTTEEIAYLLGYSNPSAFVRAFKRQTGQTIIEFKRQLGRNKP